MLTNTWDWIRILGFLSFFFFTISAAFGIIRKSNWLVNNKNLMFQLHTYAGWFGFFALIGHMLILIIDQFRPFTIFEILIPFYSDYQSFSTSLGIVAFYCFFLTMLLSDIYVFKIGFKIWKKMHFIVFPAWIMSLAHGLLIGSDSAHPVILVFYICSFLLILLLVLFRKYSPKTLRETN